MRNIVYLRGKPERMKRIILNILFLWAIVWGWNTVAEDIVPVEAIKVTEQKAGGEARQYMDQMVRVLAEANSCADVAVRPVFPLPSNLVRRYRSVFFSFGNLFSSLKTEAGIVSNSILKFSLEFSQLYAAQLKDRGHYVYALRRIIG